MSRPGSPAAPRPSPDPAAMTSAAPRSLRSTLVSSPVVALLGLALPSVGHAQQLKLVDFVQGTFIDISSTGTAVVPTNDGEFNVGWPIGNTLFPSGIVRVGANGGLRFGTNVLGSEDLPSTNGSLPNATAFGGRQALFPYWDDFIASNGAFTFGTIHHEIVGTTLIIQWTNVKLQSASVQDRITFQVQLPASGPILAQFLYDDILGAANGGSSATIGYQGNAANSFVQYSLDAGRAVEDGTVLTLIDQPNEALLLGFPGTFVDISATGIPLNMSDNGVAAFSTQVRSALVTGGTIAVGSNGGLRFSGSTNLLASVNVPLPSGNVFGGNPALLPFWDDINTQGGAVGNIYRQEFPDKLIVQWNDVGFAGSPTSERATFQVQLFDRSEVLAQVLYTDIEGARAARGASATIGYQGGGGDLATSQISFNQASVSDGSVLTFYRIDDIGTPFCAANPNSTGASSAITAVGTVSVSSNTLNLRCEGLPLNATAFFIVSDVPFFVANAGGSQGNLCLGGAIGRGVGGIRNSGGTGQVEVTADLGALPSAAGVFAAQAGDTLSFQCWHRDAVSGVTTSNFSNAVQLRFTP